ncbi:aconitate hydratase [Candidatus Bathyarchaeota archaeon]|nr:MAG: aconitate hydratase [Candidatus Bathyarchaeota archaeon]
MYRNVSCKIIEDHLVEGKPEPGNEVSIKIDQTLTQDATGTLVYMFLEAIGIEKVKTRLSVSYVDHNTLQTDSRSADSHRYLQTVASKLGVIFSKPGNGICHRIHLERFARPGWTLLGSDSHTPTAGAVGMLAIGAGGIDLAAVMSGEPYRMKMPEILGVRLTGRLAPWVSAKDVALSLLGEIGVKGGLGKILEYFGEGVDHLTVPERATIANMGTETGATSSVFPSDEETYRWLKMQGREEEWINLPTPERSEYDDIVEIDLSKLEPMIALPHSPGNVVKVSEVEGLEVQQVCIGSCTNSSYRDLAVAASILRGKKVHPNVDLTVSPGSRQVLRAIAKSGVLADLIAAGARILECACGPCIGMGQAPPAGSVSVRTFNRNFKGRSGTPDAKVYLVSPEVAAATALYGVITDPRRLGPPPKIKEPSMDMEDGLLLAPARDPSKVKVTRGPNIVPPPTFEPLPDSFEGEVLIKLGDDVSTDDILPAGADVLPLRSNIPAISKYVFARVAPRFAEKALRKGGGFIVGGENYGQGSSREHAALCPRYLGIRAVFAKSYARIHKRNLINFGIIPFTFNSPKAYELIDEGDMLKIDVLRERIRRGDDRIPVENVTSNSTFTVNLDLSERSREIILAGGLLNLLNKKYSQTKRRRM